MNKKLLSDSFRNITGSVIYIFLVSQIMSNGDKIFGETDNSFAPFAFLLLFSLSAAIVGSLVFAQSVMLFLENKRSESIKAAVYSIGWLGAYTIIGLFALYISK